MGGLPVDTDDIDESLSDEAIRIKIRDEYLRDTSVTILLVGTETAQRKHVDWELYSSMRDGRVNKQSGVLAVTLPTTGSEHCFAAHTNEKEIVYPEFTNWIAFTQHTQFEERYPYLPDRITDNLITNKARISATPWAKISNSPEILRFLIHATFVDRIVAEYDLCRPMRDRNSAPRPSALVWI
jgi:MTH538 TIR-like domain (DUF1863)